MERNHRRLLVRLRLPGKHVPKLGSWSFHPPLWPRQNQTFLEGYEVFQLLSKHLHNYLVPRGLPRQKYPYDRQAFVSNRLLEQKHIRLQRSPSIVPLRQRSLCPVPVLHRSLPRCPKCLHPPKEVRIAMYGKLRLASRRPQTRLLYECPNHFH